MSLKCIRSCTRNASEPRLEVAFTRSHGGQHRLPSLEIFYYVGINSRFRWLYFLVQIRLLTDNVYGSETNKSRIIRIGSVRKTPTGLDMSTPQMIFWLIAILCYSHIDSSETSRSNFHTHLSGSHFFCPRKSIIYVVYISILLRGLSRKSKDVSRHIPAAASAWFPTVPTRGS